MAIWGNFCKGLTIGLIFLITTTGAHAVVISGSSSVGPIPGFAGTGLDGEYYNQTAVGGTTDIADAVAFIGANSPNATFTSTSLDYPNGSSNLTVSGTPLSSFLGTDGGSLSGAGGDPVETSIMRFSGFIAIQQAGVVNFAVGSDDGTRLRIAGQTIAGNDLPGGFQFSTGVADFQAAGLYEIEVIYFENFASAGMEIFSSIPGGPDSGAPTDTVGILPTAILYDASAAPQISEPATMIGFAAGLLFLYSRRRKH